MQVSCQVLTLEGIFPVYLYAYHKAMQICMRFQEQAEPYAGSSEELPHWE